MSSFKCYAVKKNVLFAFTGVVQKEIFFKTIQIKSNQNITS